MVKLWCHENLRVFGDRLMTTEDNDWLNGVISEKIEQYFSIPAK